MARSSRYLLRLFKFCCFLLFLGKFNRLLVSSQADVEEVRLPASVNYNSKTQASGLSKKWKLIANPGEVVAVYVMGFSPRNIQRNCATLFISMQVSQSMTLKICDGRKYPQQPIYSKSPEVIVEFFVDLPEGTSTSLHLIAHGEAHPSFVGYSIDDHIGQDFTVDDEWSIFIDPKLSVPQDSRISAWTLYGKVSEDIETMPNFRLAVFRPIREQANDEYSFEVVHVFKPNFEVVSDKGESVFWLENDTRTEVRKEDCLGFLTTKGEVPLHTSSISTTPGLLSFNSTNNPTYSLTVGSNLTAVPGKLDRIFIFGAWLENRDCFVDENGCRVRLISRKCGLSIVHMSGADSPFYFWRIVSTSTIILNVLYRENSLSVIVNGSPHLTPETTNQSTFAAGQIEVYREERGFFVSTVSLCDCFCEFKSATGQISVRFPAVTKLDNMGNNNSICSYALQSPYENQEGLFFELKIPGNVRKFNETCQQVIDIQERRQNTTKTIRRLCYDDGSRQIVYVAGTSGSTVTISTRGNIITGKLSSFQNRTILNGKESLIVEYKQLMKNVPYSAHERILKEKDGHQQKVNIVPRKEETVNETIYKADEGFKFKVSVGVEGCSSNYCLDYIQILSHEKIVMFDSCRDVNEKLKVSNFSWETDYMFLRSFTDSSFIDTKFNLTFNLIRDTSTLNFSLASGTVFSPQYPSFTSASPKSRDPDLHFVLQPLGGSFVYFFIQYLDTEGSLDATFLSLSGDVLYAISYSNLSDFPQRIDINQSKVEVKLKFSKAFSFQAIYHSEKSLKACKENQLFISEKNTGFCYGPVASLSTIGYHGRIEDSTAACHVGSELADISQSSFDFITKTFVRRQNRPFVYERIDAGSRKECYKLGKNFDELNMNCGLRGIWTPICQTDIDECSLDAKTCPHRCVNKIGSHTCMCPKGFYPDPLNGTCKGICDHSKGNWHTKYPYCVYPWDPTEVTNTSETLCPNFSQLMQEIDGEITESEISCPVKDVVDNKSVNCVDHVLINYNLSSLYCVRGRVSSVDKPSLLTTPFGSISSNGYPDPATYKHELRWGISVENGFAVRISLLHCSIAGTLSIFDGTGTSTSKRLFTFKCLNGNTLYRKNVLSENKNVTVQVKGEIGKHMKFLLVYTSAVCGLGSACDSGCGSSGISQSSGHITIPSISENAVCVWHLIPSVGFSLQLNVDANLTTGSYKAYIEIFNGMKTAPIYLIGTYHDMVPLLISNKSSLTIRAFIPSIGNQYTVNYSEKDCAGCGLGYQPSKSRYECTGQTCGVIASPGYPTSALYPTVTWYITVSERHFVCLTFDEFQPVAPHCVNNRLGVYVTESFEPDDPEMAVCSTTSPKLQYKGTEIKVRFTRNFSQGRFKAKYVESSFNGSMAENKSKCEDGWEIFGFHCYKLEKSNVTISWKGASELCKNEGGDLVSILHKNEMDFVFQYINSKSERGDLIYIGLVDREKNGQYRWSDGNPACYFAWSTSAQPIANKISLCVKFVYTDTYSVNQWYQVTCAGNIMKSYMCKKLHPEGKVEMSRQRISNITSGCPAGHASLGQYCYSARLVNLNETEEKNDPCGYYSAQLANISEHDFLRLRENPNNHLIGSPFRANKIIVNSFENSGSGRICTSFKYRASVITERKDCRDNKTVLALCKLPANAIEKTMNDDKFTVNHQAPVIQEEPFSVNPPDQLFRCSNGEFILVTDVCNKDIHSLNGSDEVFCESDFHDDWFSCKNGTQIPPHLVYDFKRDCSDGEDEFVPLDWTESCSDDQCDNGQCIRQVNRCDTIKDCWDGSDEADCSAERVSPNAFVCYDGSLIARNQVCNGQVDCQGQFSEDEQAPIRVEETERCDYMSGCPVDKFTCTNRFCADLSTRCIYEKDKYMAAIGCQDMSHLSDCDDFVCPLGYVKCPGLYCIPLRYVCNGISDCPYETDEVNCSDYRCPGEYRCRNSQHCVDLDLNRCNGVPECPEGDDEELCDVVCPRGCECQGASVRCSALNLMDVPPDLHTDIRALDLSNNSIRILLSGAFDKVYKLFYLNLKHNFLKTLGGAFEKLHFLHRIELAGCGKIPVLDKQMFNTSYMTFLNLSDLEITEIKDTAFKGLPNLRRLNIEVNIVKTYTRKIFNPLVRLDILNAESYKFCCVEKRLSSCTPAMDNLSSCEDLMAHEAFRVFIWMFGITALLGNIGVIIWRSVREETNHVHALMIGNLAVADGLMGVYMVTIAGADNYYRGEYIEHSEDWLQNPICKLCGVMATVSSQVSVLTLSLITLDRFICIVYPLSFRRISLRSAKMLIAGVWTLVIILSVVPLFPSAYFNDLFYAKSGVCLPIQLTKGHPAGWEYSTAIFIVLNAVSCFGIFISYVVMFCVVRKTHRATRGTVDEQMLKTEMTIARRMILIVSTDLICWLPIIVTGILSVTSNFEISGTIYVVMAVFILPINSAINPVLYTYSTIYMGYRRKRKSRESMESDKLPLTVSGKTMDTRSQKSRYNPSAITSLCSSDSCLGLSRELAANGIVTLDTPRAMSLTQCLENGWKFTSDEIISIYRDINLALSYLHLSKLRHGEVCADNILLYKDLELKEIKAFLAGTRSLTLVADVKDESVLSDDVRDLTNVINMVVRIQGDGKGAADD